jgi:6-pyruvoyltetrahydropterin/6-carboxytetrahydropterin synthase
MMYQLTKSFSFSAAHVLEYLPKEHPCSRLHGHNYEVEVVIESFKLDHRDFCQIDYAELDVFADFLKNTFDHRCLNDVMKVRTTAENLARELCTWCKAISPFVAAVRVSETPRTWVEYRP